MHSLSLEVVLFYRAAVISSVLEVVGAASLVIVELVVKTLGQMEELEAEEFEVEEFEAEEVFVVVVMVLVVVEYVVVVLVVVVLVVVGLVVVV